MDLSAEARLRLSRWLKLDTWSSAHPLDQRRFHEFVNQIAKDGISQMDPEDIIQHAEQAFGFQPTDYQKETFDRMILTGNSILSFLEDTGRI